MKPLEIIGKHLTERLIETLNTEGLSELNCLYFEAQSPVKEIIDSMGASSVGAWYSFYGDQDFKAEDGAKYCLVDFKYTEERFCAQLRKTG